MTALTFALPKTAVGSGFVVVEDEFETAVQVVVDDLADQIAAGVTGLTPKGNFNAGGGAFPSGAVAGDFYFVSAAGTVNSQAFAIGDWLVALINAPSTSIYAGNWVRADYSKVLPIGIFKKYYATVAALKADTATFATGDRLWAAGFVYTVVASGGHLITSGSVRLNVTPDNRGYNVRAFGATGNNVTDDVAPIQAAINAAQNDGVAGVYFPAGGYYCSTDLYFVRDATFNPGFPSGELLAGRVIYAGTGAMDREDFKADRIVGSVIRFAAGKRAVMSTSGQRGQRRVVQDLSFIGSHSQIISDPRMTNNSVYQNLFVGTDAPADGVAVFHVGDNYICKFSNIVVIGQKDFAYTFDNDLGWGFWAEPSDTAGGANVYENITGAYFDKGVVFGKPYDAADVGISKIAEANLCINIQGQFANNGIEVMHNFQASTFIGAYAEGCVKAPMKIANSAAYITIESFKGVMDTTLIGDRGVIVIGDDTGTAGVDAARHITIRSGRFICTAGVAAVFVHSGVRDIYIERNAFSNNGGAAVAVPSGALGGEIVLEDNDYQPATAGTPIEPIRRLCVITGTFASPSYADASGLGRRLDYSVGTVAASVDASTWRRPPEFIAFNTTAASRTLTLPNLSGAGGRVAEVTVIKPNSNNTVTIDAGTGATIKGAQTYVMTAAYSAITLRHAGNGTTVWNVVQES
jgi:hypothetical protein